MRETNEAALFQWLLELPPLADVLGWPIQVTLLAEAGAKVHRLSKADPGDAEAIAEAWNELCGALGPVVMLQVMASGHWQELVPKVEGNAPGEAAIVWRNEESAVVAEAIKDERGVAQNVVFRVI